VSTNPSESNTPDVIEASHRRAPRYGRFIGTGVVLGGVIAFLLVWFTRGNSAVSNSDLFWLLMLSLGPLGALAGAATAYFVDVRSAARADSQRPAAEPPAKS